MNAISAGFEAPDSQPLVEGASRLALQSLYVLDKDTKKYVPVQPKKPV